MPVSVLALVARFCVLGLRRLPRAQQPGRRRTRSLLPEQVNLGFAAQTDRGAGGSGGPRCPAHDHPPSCPRRSPHRTGAGPDGTLTPAELTGGTFTVNNYGVFGVDGSAAIINHPEVAILGIGRIIDRPWVRRRRSWRSARSPS